MRLISEDNQYLIGVESPLNEDDNPVVVLLKMKDR